MTATSLTLLLSLCLLAATRAYAEPATEPAPPSAEFPCKADALRPFIGKPLDEATIAAALKRSGSATFRIVRPGEPLSMDYATYRLTIEVDRDNRILSLYCG